jgi:hypothetical protein
MNNYKTYILATIAGSTLFSLSFAIGANSNRIQTSSENTRNFVYPKVDEIDRVESSAASTKAGHRKTKISTDEISVVAPKHHRHTEAAPITRTTRISKKVPVKTTQPSIDIPVSPPGEIPVDRDLSDRQNPVDILKKVASESKDKVRQSDEKQPSKQAEPQEIKEEIEQTKEEKKIAPKASPEKAPKEIAPEHKTIDTPKEAKSEPSGSPEPQD